MPSICSSCPFFMLNRDDGHLLNKTDDDSANPHSGPGLKFLGKMPKVYHWLFISWQNLCISNTLSLKTDDEAFNPHSGPEIKFVGFLAAALFLNFLERSNLLWTSLLIRTSFFYFSSAHVEASGCNFKALCRKGHVVSH